MAVGNSNYFIFDDDDDRGNDGSKCENMQVLYLRAMNRIF